MILMLFFSTWLDLIGLFFCWPHLISFDSFKRYVGITFMEKKRYFSILFGFPFEIWKTNKKKIKILIFYF